MFKKLLFGITIILFTSCDVNHTDFSGDWIDKKNESHRMIIKKNGDNYIVENRGKKYPAQIKNGLLEISTELPIKAIIDENDNLIIGGKEYLRIKNSILGKMKGDWKTSTDDYISYPSKFSISLNENKKLVITYDNGMSERFKKISYRQKNITGIWYSEDGPAPDKFEQKFNIKFENEKLIWTIGELRLSGYRQQTSNKGQKVIFERN